MNTTPPYIKKPHERDNLDLLELVCQLHSRAMNQPNNKLMHDYYIEAREEMESRLKNPPQEKVVLPSDKLWKIAKRITELQKKSSEASQETKDAIDWDLIEEDWFDYLEEAFLSEKEEKTAPLCNHDFYQVDAYWSKCSLCGFIKPVSQSVITKKTMSFTSTTIMPIGPHKGKRLCDITVDYLQQIFTEISRYAPNKRTLNEKYLYEYLLSQNFN